MNLHLKYTENSAKKKNANVSAHRANAIVVFLSSSVLDFVLTWSQKALLNQHRKSRALMAHGRVCNWGANTHTHTKKCLPLITQSTIQACPYQTIIMLVIVLPSACLSQCPVFTGRSTEELISTVISLKWMLMCHVCIDPVTTSYMALLCSNKIYKTQNAFLFIYQSN